jgi:hypothetical protein
MSKLFFKALILGCFLFIFQTTVNAQDNSPAERSNILIIGTKKTAKIGGKIAFAVVKETAKLGWATAKFTTKEVAAPIVKTIVVKAAPKASSFILKKGVPIAGKLMLKYLML